MELLATLVRGAIGFNADRGDTVDVINMEFADWQEEAEGMGPFFGIDKNDLLHMAEVLVLSIVAVLVILLVVRPLVSRAFDTISPVAAMGERLLADQAAGTVIAPPEEIEEEIEELIDIDRVEGRVKSSSAKQIGDFVDKYPQEALSIIRGWMQQGPPVAGNSK
jgi:flagellar M-ring protein FliF